MHGTICIIPVCHFPCCICSEIVITQLTFYFIQTHTNVNGQPITCHVQISAIRVHRECRVYGKCALPSLEVPIDKSLLHGNTVRWLFITLLFGTYLFKTSVIEKEEDDITRDKGCLWCRVSHVIVMDSM